MEESVSGNTDEVEAWLSLSPLLHVWGFWFSFSLPSNMFVNYDDEINWIKKLLAPMYFIFINWLLCLLELHFCIYSSEHYDNTKTYSYFKLSVILRCTTRYQSNLEFILKLICRSKFSWYFHERYDTPFNTPQSTFIYVSEYWGKSKPW